MANLTNSISAITTLAMQAHRMPSCAKCSRAPGICDAWLSVCPGPKIHHFYEYNLLHSWNHASDSRDSRRHRCVLWRG